MGIASLLELVGGGHTQGQPQPNTSKTRRGGRRHEGEETKNGRGSEGESEVKKDEGGEIEEVELKQTSGE